MVRRNIRSPRAAVNHSLGCLGRFVKETANATHSLSCSVPDRESNETELFDEWQKQFQGVPRVSRPSSEHGEVVLIERGLVSKHHVSCESL